MCKQNRACQIPREKKPKGKRTQVVRHSGLATQKVEHSFKEKKPFGVSRAIDRPYQPSYFLPRKMHRQSLQLFVDTRCNTNTLSQRLSRKLLKEIQATLQKCDRQGFLTDGSPLAFYGVIQIEGTIRSVAFQGDFVVSKIGDVAILGVPFLESHDCRMDFT